MLPHSAPRHSLLNDGEQEVRTAAAAKICDFAKALPKDRQAQIIETKLSEPITSLANDNCQHVRTSLAKVILGISPLVGKRATTGKVFEVGRAEKFSKSEILNF